jgi:AraC-like DNA-binding protein
LTQRKCIFTIVFQSKSVVEHGMTQLLHRMYSASRFEDFPKLFSSTDSFSFFSETGRLNHAFIPDGPRGFSIVRVSTTGHRVAVTESKRRALTIQLRGSASVKTDKKSFDAKAGDITILNPCHRRSVLNASGGRDYLSYTVLAPAHDEGGASGCEQAICRRDPKQYALLRDLLTFSFDLLAGSISDGQAVKLGASIEALIEELFRNSADHDAECISLEDRSHRHDVIVARAQDYISAHFSEPISIYDIARAAGTTVRTLQNATQSRLGVAPRALLTEFRLVKMRSGLSAPDEMTSVTSAAHDAGLVHLGRASIVYRERFGESPSATLKRSMRSGRRDRH